MLSIPKGYKVLENAWVTGWHSSGKAIVSDGRHNIYVSRVIPGERVSVAVAKRQRRNYIAGEVISIIQPSDFRVRPICPHFEVCGGCNWMYMQYEQQLVQKKKLIEQAFAKYQIPHPPLDDVVSSPRPLAYRGKVDFAITLSPDGEVNIGYHPIEDARTVFSLKECYITDPQVIETARRFQQTLNEFLKAQPSFQEITDALKGFTLRCNKNGDQLITINALHEFSGISAIVDSLVQHNTPLKSIFLKLHQPEHSVLRHLWGTTFLEETLNQWHFRLSADAFFQPNIHLADQLFKEIVMLASPSTNDIVYDLYTGVGTIAIHLAPYVKKVVGVENSETAIQDAINNQLRNNLDNITFVVGDVLKTFVPSFVDKHGKPDIVVLDPPRAGTLIETLKNLVSFQPKRIVYVSCNPVSLAWNLTYLKDFYSIERVVPFDMFPQTHHVETIVLLTRS